jgi:hypothetical protein
VLSFLCQLFFSFFGSPPDDFDARCLYQTIDINSTGLLRNFSAKGLGFFLIDIPSFVALGREDERIGNFQIMTE